MCVCIWAHHVVLPPRHGQLVCKDLVGSGDTIAVQLGYSMAWCEDLRSFTPVCFKCSQVASAVTTLFVVTERETAPMPLGVFEGANNFIVWEDGISNFPEMFQNFLLLFFAGSSRPSRVSKENSKIVSSNLR